MRSFVLILLLASACVEDALPEPASGEPPLASNQQSLLAFTTCNGHCGQVSFIAGQNGSCTADCVYKGTCMSDVKTYCQVDQEDTIVTSCGAAQAPAGRSNRCGMGLAPYEQGCDCSSSCGFTGTCCTDVATTCNGGAASAGEDFFQKVSGSSMQAYAASFRRRDTRAFLSTSARVAYGLRQVRLGDIDTRGEVSLCSIEPKAYPAGTLWSLNASTNYDDNDAKCGLVGIRYPASSDFTPGAEVARSGSNGSDWVSSSDTSAYTGKELYVLTRFSGEDTDKDSGEPIECAATVDGSNRWLLGAWSDGDASVGCKWRKLSWNTSALSLSGEYTASWSRYVPSSPTQSSDRTIMTTDRTSACFLTGVMVDNVDTHEEFAGCEIAQRNGYWVLYARGKLTGDNQASCRARCISFNDAPGVRWPRNPDTELDVYEKKAGGFRHAGTASLWLGRGAGASVAYDRPTVVIEGFDPGERIGSSAYEIKAATFMTRMLASSAGGLSGDVWFFNPDGSQPLGDASRQIGLMLQLAWTYGGYNTAVNRRFPVAGISQGGLTGRVALAEWETGKYAGVSGYYRTAQPWIVDFGKAQPADPPSSTALNIPAISGTTPPAKLFFGFAGPQNGAVVPHVLQGALQEVAVNIKGNLSQSPIIQMVSSTPAKQMLDADVVGYTGFFTDKVTQLSKGTFRQGTFDIYGNEPAVWKSFPIRHLEDGVTISTVEHDKYFGIANSAGPLKNGYPVSVTTVGVVNAGFLPQGCANFAPDDGWCRSSASPDYGTAYGWSAPGTFTVDGAGHGPPFALFRMVDDGHTFMSLGDRNSRGYLHFGAPIEVLPGDLSESHIEDLQFDATSMHKQISTLWIKQYAPFIRTPTVSALHCPGATSLASCRAQNRGARRFDEVLGRVDNKNGTHGGMDGDMFRRAMALWWDYTFDNQDGMLKNPANPWGYDFTSEGLVGTPNAPIALQVCQSVGAEWINDFDDNCNGQIDEGSATGANAVFGRISYWMGKVNLHTDASGAWQKDSDCSSGANLDPLTYCRKFWPETSSVTSVAVTTKSGTPWWTGGCDLAYGGNGLQEWTCNGTTSAPLCSSTVGSFNACQGNACTMCNEKLAGYDCYFVNHPACSRNDACIPGYYAQCNADCPAPTVADICDATQVCGNSVCDGNETCATCPGDCGTCASTCSSTAGNWQGCSGYGCAVCSSLLAQYPCYAANHPACETVSTCGAAITCSLSCPAPDADDACASTPDVDGCGDGICSGVESTTTCPADCSKMCGDQKCNGGETATTCPGDCNNAALVCGDGLCNGNDTCSSCPGDCGACSRCGDGICSLMENASLCPADCPSGPQLGRISYWMGKVNVHTDPAGAWVFDPDCSSGANLDPLAYCRKWWPTTVTAETSTVTPKTGLIWKTGGCGGSYEADGLQEWSCRGPR